MLLGIDYGSKKIGLAIGSKETNIASPYKVIYETNLKKQLEVILQIIKEDEIKIVIIGLPIDLDSRETVQTGKVKEFIATLQQKLPQDVTLIPQDERLSTKMSRKLLQDIKIQDDDAVAAAIILQSYLDKP